MDVERRFLSKVDKDGPLPVAHPEAGPCWLWTAGRIWTGYGHFWFMGEDVKAHRFAYEFYVGSIPDGMTIDHLCHGWDESCVGGVTCHHRGCVNPQHLEVVERGENVLRGNTITARNRSATHCTNGHEFTPSNTKTVQSADGRSHRECKLCRLGIDRRHKDRLIEQRRLARISRKG